MWLKTIYFLSLFFAALALGLLWLIYWNLPNKISAIEYSHAASAVLNLAALIMLILSILAREKTLDKAL